MEQFSLFTDKFQGFFTTKTIPRFRVYLLDGLLHFPSLENLFLFGSCASFMHSELYCSTTFGIGKKFTILEQTILNILILFCNLLPLFVSLELYFEILKAFRFYVFLVLYTIAVSECLQQKGCGAERMFFRNTAILYFTLLPMNYCLQ